MAQTIVKSTANTSFAAATQRRSVTATQAAPLNPKACKAKMYSALNRDSGSNRLWQLQWGVLSHLCSLQARRFLRWPLHNVRSVPAFGLMGNSPKGHVRKASQTRKIKGEDDNPSAAPTSASRCTNQNKSKLCNLVMKTRATGHNITRTDGVH